MTCSDFLARYTDFRDGGLSLEAAGRCGDHLQSCPACRRYDEVVSRATDLLRAMPGAEPPEDFQARLQHSIYSLHEERRRQRILRGGSGAMSVVAMTAIVATLVLVPVFWESDAVVELPPIVVAEPAAVVRSQRRRPSRPRRTECLLPWGPHPSSRWNSGPNRTRFSTSVPPSTCDIESPTSHTPDPILGMENPVWYALDFSRRE